MMRQRKIGLWPTAGPQKSSQQPCPLAGEITVCDTSLRDRAYKQTYTRTEQIASATCTLRQQTGRECNDAASKRQFQNVPNCHLLFQRSETGEKLDKRLLVVKWKW